VVSGLSEVQCDVYLDAIALMTIHHHDDQETFDALLAATDHCPWYLEQLVNALADLAVLALEKLPDDVDRYLDALRQFVLSQR
jgi:hypothetical protein